MPGGIDHVEIPLSRETISLPWASREALVERFKHLDSMREARQAFEDVCASRTVVLAADQKGALIEVIEQWSTQVEGGLRGLPPGIFELRNALHDDLHDRPNG